MGRLIITPVQTIVEWITQNPISLLIAFIGYMIVYMLSVIRSSPKPGKNPFYKDWSFETKELVTDREKRKSVLKKAFSTERIPKNLDVIVIGSGIGGLCAANLLAKAGKRVLVLEQHTKFGGCCHTFVKNECEFDVGIHYIGEMRNNTISAALMCQITDGQLRWVDMCPQFDTVIHYGGNKKNVYHFEEDPVKWRDNMIKYFPNDVQALDKFTQLIQQNKKNMLEIIKMKILKYPLAKLLGLLHLNRFFTSYFTLASRTLRSVLNGLTKNEALKMVLSYNFLDYGTPPSQASFYVHAALFEHYKKGASYPYGGASEIPFQIVQSLEKLGGVALTKALVKEILINEKGHAYGVRVRSNKADVEIFAPCIISDAGVMNTYHGLLPKEVAVKSDLYRYTSNKLPSGVNRTNRLTPGVGCLSIFVSLDGSSEELGLKASNYWIYAKDYHETSLEGYLNLSREQAVDCESPIIYVAFPSAKDPSYEQRFPGKSACTILAFTNWDWFTEWSEQDRNKRDEEYSRFKSLLCDRLIAQFIENFPFLKDRICGTLIGSPLTNKHYLMAQKGETYGLDHDMPRFSSPLLVSALRPKTQIPGLYLTGQDILQCGLVSSAFSGLLCASQILNRNLVKDLLILRSNSPSMVRRIETSQI